MKKPTTASPTGPTSPGSVGGSGGSSPTISGMEPVAPGTIPGIGGGTPGSGGGSGGGYTPTAPGGPSTPTPGEGPFLPPGGPGGGITPGPGDYGPPGEVDEPDAFDPSDPSFPDIEDGVQMILRRAYWSMPYEDEYGFMNPDGFLTIHSIRKYRIPDIDSQNSRVNYTPSSLPDAYDHVWEYGEEPIQYNGAVYIGGQESGDWPEFTNFVENGYEDLTFTSYREIERYLNWYDYTPEDLNFGFEWKSDQAEYRQSNQLRPINKTRTPGLTLGPMESEMRSYTLHAEAPHLMPISDEYYGSGFSYGGVSPTGGSIMVANEPGFAFSCQLDVPTWLVDALKKRFKTRPTVDRTRTTYLDNLTRYAQSSGFTTVLKRALTSESQPVTRFTRREFTGLGESTLTFNPEGVTTSPGGSSLTPVTAPGAPTLMSMIGTGGPTTSPGGSGGGGGSY